MAEQLVYGIRVDGAENAVQQLNKAEAELKAVTKARNDLIKRQAAGDELSKQEVTLLTKLTQKQAQLKAEKTRYNKIVTTEQKLTQANIGAYGKLQQSLNSAKLRYQDLAASGRENTKEGQRLVKQIQSQDAELKRIDATMGQHQRNVGDYKNQIKLAAQELEKERAALIKKQAALQKDIAGMKKGTTEYNLYQKELQETTAKINQLNAAQGKSTVTTGKMGKAFSGLKSQVLGVIAPMMGIYGAIRLIGGAIKTMVSFELQMAKVKAISGATAEEFQQLKQNAKDLGAATQFTAAEVAGLQVEYSKLGFSTQETLAATEATISLATATGEDLASAATVAGATIRGFNLDATETGRVVDVMAKSFTSSALDLEKFRESMKYVAPVAESLGISVEEVTAQLSALADAGISGSMAGTSLRKIYQEMATSGLDADAAFEKLTRTGLTLADANDEVGARAQSALLILANQSEKIDELTTSYENATGASKAMADIIEDTTSGSLKKLGSAWDGLILSLGQSDGALKGVIDGFASLLNGITAFINKTDEYKGLLNFMKILGLTVATFTAYKLAVVASTVATKAYAVWSKAAAISSKVMSTAVGLATGKISLATVAQKALNLAMKMNPAGLIVAGIVALTTAIVLFTKRTNAATRQQQMFNDLQDDVNSKLADQRGEIEPLIAILKNQNAAEHERIAAYKELKEIAPDVIGNLDYERAKVEDLTESYDLYIKKLERQIRTDIYKNKIAELIKAEDQLQAKIDEAAEDVIDTGFFEAAFNTLIGNGIDKDIVKLTKLSAQLKETQAQRDELYKKLGENVEAPTIKPPDVQPIIEAIDKISDKDIEIDAEINIEDNEKQLDDFVKRFEEAQKRVKEIGDKSTFERLEAERQQLEQDYTDKLISKNQFEAKKADIEKQAAEALFNFKKDYDLVSSAELEQAEIDRFTAKSARLLELGKLTEEEYQAAIDEIRQEWKEKREAEQEEEEPQAEQDTFGQRVENLRNSLDEIDQLYAAGKMSAEDYKDSVKEVHKKIAIEYGEQAEMMAGYTKAFLGSLDDLLSASGTKNKALAYGMALLNTFQGVTLALIDRTIPNTFARIAAAATVLTTGLAQVVKIKNTKFKEGGAIIGGKPHSNGGTKFVGEDGTTFEAERGEFIAVVNKRDAKTAAAYSEINSKHGKKFENGGTVTTNNSTTNVSKTVNEGDKSVIGDVFNSSNYETVTNSISKFKSGGIVNNSKAFSYTRTFPRSYNNIRKYATGGMVVPKSVTQQQNIDVSDIERVIKNLVNIPVVVAESDITTAQRSVKVAETKGDF